MSEKELSERKKKVLQALVESYITSVEPISSSAIQSEYLPSVSAATIRSELATLEELGYLTQPHISSGRVPSSKAYKYYVNNFIDTINIDSDDIKKMVKQRYDSVNGIVTDSAKIVSDATNYTSMLILSGADNIIIKEIKLVDLFDGSALVLVITDCGVVANKQIKLSKVCCDNYIQTANELINKAFAGKYLSEIIGGQDAISQELSSFKDLCDDVISLIEELKKSRNKVFVEGQQKIFDYPEYQNLDNVKNFMSLVSQEDKLQSLLKENSDIKFSIKIGSEDDEKLKNMAVVSAVYKVDGKEVGQLGVIGPERMDYKKVLKVLNQIGKIIEDINKDD